MTLEIALGGTCITLLGTLIMVVFRTGRIVEKIGRFEEHGKHLDEIPKIMQRLEMITGEQQTLRAKVSEFNELKTRVSVLEAGGRTTLTRLPFRSRHGDEDDE